MAQPYGQEWRYYFTPMFNYPDKVLLAEMYDDAIQDRYGAVKNEI
jgi:hypothetical protein